MISDALCNVMFMCNHWEHYPMDIAVVNRMTCEDLHLVDPDQNTFKLHCATKMSQQQVNKCRRDALYVGVEICRYETTFHEDQFNIDIDMQNKLKDMDVVIGHYPQTHNDVLNCDEYLHENAIRIFFIHAVDDLDSFKEFSKDLAGSDYVYCISEEIEREYRKYLRRANVKVYLPSCPLEIVPAQDMLEKPKTTGKEPRVKLMTYYSGFCVNPNTDYNIQAMKDIICQSDKKMLWKIVTSMPAVEGSDQRPKCNIPSTEGNVTVEYHTRSGLSELYQEDICDATYWALPSLMQQHLSRLDIVLAVGSGTPILSHLSKEELINELKRYMDVPEELGNDITFGNLSDPLDYEELSASARNVLRHYLLDTKSAQSHKQFITNLLGNSLFYEQYSNLFSNACMYIAANRI